MEGTLADACRPADVDVVRKMLAAARASAAKMATADHAQQQQQQQQRGRAADLPHPAQCRPRSQERAALPPPPTVAPPSPPPPPVAVAAATPVEQQRDAEAPLRDGHGSVRSVQAEAEVEEALQVRVSCVYDLMTAKCGELGRTSAELIGDVSVASQASILLDQLEFLPDGSVDRSEWCDWFGALHSIGQSPDSILDVLLDEFRRLPRGRSSSARGSGVDAPEPSLQTPVPVPRWGHDPANMSELPLLSPPSVHPLHADSYMSCHNGQNTTIMTIDESSVEAITPLVHTVPVGAVTE
eukprot:Rhum_TRINITY_DN13736_c0_g2::Rhum_TRINITY_DN13736_c0_g2_i1::g.63530::m.63530